MTRKARTRCTALQPLEPRTMLSAVPQLVGNFDVTPGEAHHAWLGNDVFFAADDGSGDVELWKSDGKPEGTLRVSDIRPGASGSQPRDFTAINGKALFTAYNDELGRELWSADGTEQGTVLVRDFTPGPKSSDLHSFTPNGGELFFASYDANAGNNVFWKTDGTSAGTQRVESIPQVRQGSVILPHNQYVVFVEDGELRAGDGTPEGTSTLRNFGMDDEVHLLTLVGEEVYFAVYVWPRSADDPSSELWRTDGTEAGTERVHSFGPLTFVSSITAANDRLYVTVDPDEPRPETSELWQSDGTSEGTMWITTVDSSIHPREVDGQLYFVKDDPETGRELWRTDGTELGTVPVEIAAGAASSDPWIMADNEQNLIIWSTATETQGLWALRAGETQPELLKSGNVGPSGGGPGYFSFVEASGKTFFTANGSLWHSDGTDTVRVEMDHVSRNLSAVGDQVYFTVDDKAGDNTGMWRTDGTAEGTVHVAGVDDGLANPGDLSGVTASGGSLYFWGKGIDEEGKLWRLDSDSDKPVVVKELPGSRRAPEIADLNGELLFTIGPNQDDVHELWKISQSTGQAEHVSQLPAAARLFTAINQVYVRIGGCCQPGGEVWRSDGTSAGTYSLGDFPGLDRITIGGDRAYIQAGGLWTSDGTVEGTRFVNSFHFNRRTRFFAVGETLFFYIADDVDQKGLWKSDGTIEGTALVKEINLSDDSMMLGSGAEFVYFRASEPSTGNELWRSDGTEAGTVLVADLNPGPADSKYLDENSAVEMNGHLYFTGDDGFHGNELWSVPIPSVPVAGDANGDGEVDFGDFLVLSANFGKSQDAVFADGDFDGTGTVDFADFLILSANFGVDFS